MEKIALISDIHGNIHALNAVLQDIKERGVNKLYCLGDYVTKCSHPDLVIDKLRDVSDIMLIGNCDEFICRPEMKNRNFWSRNIIGEERAKFVYSLPKSYDFYVSGHLIRAFHASPYSLIGIYNPMFSNKNTIYSSTEIHDPNKMFDNTDFIGKTKDDDIPDIVVYGHIHTPVMVRYKNKTIINTGSVGIPVEMLNNDLSDKTNKFSTLASYTIIEGNLGNKELGSISFNEVRVLYNIKEEIDDLEKTNMPNKEKIITTLLSAIPNNS